MTCTAITLDECDTRIRRLVTDIASMKDQIAAHDLAVQRKEAACNTHWLRRVRTAKRLREAELAELRDLRPKLKPQRSFDIREFIIDVAHERLGAAVWVEVMAEARARAELKSG